MTGGPGGAPPARVICLAPNPSIDRLVEVGRLVPGEIHRPRLVAATAGGKGLNAARAARRLGAQVTAVAILAGHAGRWIAERLGEEGVDLRAHWIEGETRISTSIADRATKRLTEIYEPGPAIGEADWAAYLALVEDALAAAPRPSGRADAGRPWPYAIAAISGSLPPGAPDDGLAAICGRAADAGVRLLVDSHGAAVERVLEAPERHRPTWLKANAVEATELLGGPRPADPDGALRLAAAIARRLDRGSSESGGAVVTVGRAGAGAWLDGQGWLVGPTPVTGRYPVASGDSMTAGLIVAFARGEAPDSALRLAAGAAAANALVPGTSIFDPEAARQLGQDIDLGAPGRRR